MLKCLALLLAWTTVTCSTPIIKGFDLSFDSGLTEKWHYKYRFYLEDEVAATVKPSKSRAKRNVYKTGILTDGVKFRTKKETLRAVLKGGDLEDEGFIRIGVFDSNNTKANLEFYKCFNSFRQILKELKRAYKLHNETKTIKSELILNDNEDATSNLTNQNQPDVNNSTFPKWVQARKNHHNNTMWTVSNLFLDDKGNRNLIGWLNKQIAANIDSMDTLWSCKARVIVLYKCCWDVLEHNQRKHWGELHVLVG